MQVKTRIRFVITVTGTGGGFRSGDHFSAGRWDYKVIRWSLRYA